LRLWGVSVEEITDKMAHDWRIEKAADGTYGVMVTSVRSGSPAEQAEPRLQYGDVLRGIGDKNIGTFADAVKAYREIMGDTTDREKIPEFLLLKFMRDRTDQVTLIKPRPDKKMDPPREVPRAWVGIASQPVVRDLARELGHPDSRGFRVTRIYPKTLAAGADLRVGDLIMSVNGDKMQPSGIQDAPLLQRKIRTLKIDQPAKMTVLRKTDSGYQTVEVEVPLERTRVGPEEARRDRNADFELVVRELTFIDRDDYYWDDSIQGVLVDSAEQLGWAGVAGVGAGDLIQKIGEYDITDLESYRKAMLEIAKAQPERVIFVVLRGQTTLFRYTEPEWKPKTAEELKEESGAK